MDPATRAVVQIGSSDERFAFGMNRSGRAWARAKAGAISAGTAFRKSRRRIISPPDYYEAHIHAWCMGFLQNYLGLEPAYKDGYDLPLLGMTT